MAPKINCNNLLQNQRRILRIGEVVSLTGLSRSTIWRLEKCGQFPSKRKLTDFSVGYFASDIETWLAGREVATKENCKPVAPEFRKGRKPKDRYTRKK